jgi:Skp family chaperone for outer membrane proteins
MQGPTRSYLINLMIVALIAGLFVYQSQGMRPGLNVQPSVLVTVNLERVFDGLDERARADEKLATVAEQLQVQAEQKAAAIDEGKEELELLQAGSAAYQEALEELTRKTLDYQAFAEFSRRKIEVQKAQALKRIYADIKEAAGTMAQQNGYDVVFVDDSVAAMGGGTEQEVNRQISGRRMLYVNPAIDATDVLIATMNAGS